MTTRPEGILRTPMGVYVLQHDTHLSRWVENSRRLDIEYNVSEIATFAHVIPEGGIVIDAGACLGDHTVTYSQLVGATGHVYAFEPHPLTYQALCLNMARLTNVTVYPQGLSDGASQGTLALDPNIGASYLTEDGGTPVELVSLDACFPNLPRCDFIHLDAEGLEPKILDGGRRLIETFHPALVVEVCDQHLRRAGSSEKQLLAMIESFGYFVFPIPGQTCAEQRDVLAVRKSRS
jgi:FkbM family methyltransferase